MRKYYMSYIDFSEVENITAEEEQLNFAITRMTELGLLTEKGNPSPTQIETAERNTSPAFFQKLERRIRRRREGIQGVYNTFRMMYERKDYYGAYFYLAFLYGFLEWQVPEQIRLLPAVPEALKLYIGMFITAFDEYVHSCADETEQTDSDRENNA